MPGFKQSVKKKLVHNIFDKPVDELENLLPSFGTNLAIDSKAILLSKGKEMAQEQKDGRRDLDADWSKSIKVSGRGWDSWSK